MSAGLFHSAFVLFLICLNYGLAWSVLSGTALTASTYANICTYIIKSLYICLRKDIIAMSIWSTRMYWTSKRSVRNKGKCVGWSPCPQVPAEQTWREVLGPDAQVPRLVLPPPLWVTLSRVPHSVFLHFHIYRVAAATTAKSQGSQEDRMSYLVSITLTSTWHMKNCAQMLSKLYSGGSLHGRSRSAGGRQALLASMEN